MALAEEEEAVAVSWMVSNDKTLERDRCEMLPRLMFACLIQINAVDFYK